LDFEINSSTVAQSRLRAEIGKKEVRLNQKNICGVARQCLLAHFIKDKLNELTGWAETLFI
jgi:hypothetical protein